MKGPKPRPVIDRLAEKIDFTSHPDGCWIWQGSLVQGYGQLSVGSKADGSMTKRRAHRLLYLLVVGEVEDGLELDHLCRNRACVNPDHLEPVTRRENQRRGDTIFGRADGRPHCLHGHPWTERTTYIKPDGVKSCRICKSESAKRRRMARSQRGAA